MNQLSELKLNDNQIGIIIVQLYSFNQRIQEISNELKTLEAAEKKEEYLTIDFFSRPKRIEKLKKEWNELMVKEQSRNNKWEEKIKAIKNLYQTENDLFNSSFIVWGHPTTRAKESSLKNCYQMICGQEKVFEIAPRLGYDMKTQEILTPIWFLMDLTLHHEKKFNFIFMMENEKHWFKKFIEPIRSGKKLKIHKIQGVNVTLLDF